MDWPLIAPSFFLLALLPVLISAFYFVDRLVPFAKQLRVFAGGPLVACSFSLGVHRGLRGYSDL